jgi:hypothetical protein
MWRRTNEQNLSKVVYKKEKFEIIIVPRPEVKCPISVHMSHSEARQQPKGNPTKTYSMVHKNVNTDFILKAT